MLIARNVRRYNGGRGEAALAHGEAQYNLEKMKKNKKKKIIMNTNTLYLSLRRASGKQKIYIYYENIEMLEREKGWMGECHEKNI